MSDISKHARELNLDGRVMLFDVDLTPFGGQVQYISPLSNVIGNGNKAAFQRLNNSNRGVSFDFEGVATPSGGQLYLKLVYDLTVGNYSVGIKIGAGADYANYAVNTKTPATAIVETRGGTGPTTAQMESRWTLTGPAGVQVSLVMKVPTGAYCTGVTITLPDTSGAALTLREISGWLLDSKDRLEVQDELCGVGKLVPVGTTPLQITADELMYAPIRWRGKSYIVMPVEASGFEARSEGQLPRPKISISNVLGVGTGWLRTYGDIAGAVVTRWVTYRRFLDDGAQADINSHLPKEVYTIDQKSAHDKTMIEWDMASILDQQGVKLPGRQVLRTGCQFLYRHRDGASWDYTNVTCPYVGGVYFTDRDVPTVDPTKDKCSQQLSGCLLRFSSPNQKVPFGGFPGVGRVRR